MKIVLVGPGAMGCLFAGLLTESLADCEVWLLDNDSSRAGEIADSGVRIESGDESRTVSVNITCDPGVFGPADVLVLFVKSYDTRGATEFAMPLVGSSTAVVSLQNGLGNVDQIAEFVERPAIVRGVTSYGSTLLGTGHVRHAGTGPTVVAPVDPAGAERARTVSDTLAKAGIEARVGANWQELVWNKIVVNAAINPLAAMSDVPNGRLIEDEGLRRVLHSAGAEAAAVAEAKGIVMDDPIAEVEKVCHRTSGNIASMLQDVRNGERTEVDSITGVVVTEGRALGIPVPTNEMLLTRVRQMAEDGPPAERDT